MQKLDKVPVFTLYGEQHTEETAEFIHIEPIASRSRSLGWQIKPHRHGRMLQCIFIYTGSVTTHLDDEQYHSQAPCCISIPPGMVHSFDFSPETEGLVLTTAENLVLAEDHGRARPFFEHLLNQAEVIEFRPTDPELDRLRHTLAQLEGEFRSLAPGRWLMCEWLLRMVLMTLSRKRLHSKHIEQHTHEPITTLQQFRQLIEQHYREQWRVEDYAQALNTTPSRLNRLCKEAMQRNAKSLLQERLLLEAKRKLVYTRTHIDQIAFDLGFSDPGYFSRFFKQHTGASPRAFREKH
ncbi:MAG: helix-turn-helix domain-containing protein [Saccharospirillum sp.]